MSAGLISDPALRQQRIEEKRQQLLSWLVDFTWTTPAIAGEVMGLKTRAGINKTLKQFESMDLIKSKSLQLGNSKNFRIVGITPNGLLWCDGKNNNFKNPCFDVERVALSTINHRLDIQRCRLKVLRHNELIWLAENNLPTDLDYRPDAIIHFEDRIVALELERTAKTRKRYQQIIVQHLRQIKQGHYDQVHYVSTINGFAIRLSKLFLSIPTLTVKGQQILFNEDLKNRFEFYNFNEWKLLMN